MKSLLVYLALTLGAGAETLGVLGHVSDGRATFLEGSQARTYGIPTELARRLAQRGVGSRWEYNPEGSLVQAALDRGNDSNVQAALQTLAQFVTAVNGQQWPSAAACMPARSPAAVELASFFARHTISPDRSDWSLSKLLDDQIQVKIHSIQGGVFDDGFETSTSPTDFSNEFTLRRTGYRWKIESFR